MVDNLIPFIGGEEEKSEQEPLKVWGHIEGDKIINASEPSITTQCLRVPVSDGHTAAVFVSFDKKPSKDDILKNGVTLRVRLRSLICRPHQNSSFTTLKTITVLRLSWTEISKEVWPFLPDV